MSINRRESTMKSSTFPGKRPSISIHAELVFSRDGWKIQTPLSRTKGSIRFGMFSVDSLPNSRFLWKFQKLRAIPPGVFAAGEG